MESKNVQNNLYLTNSNVSQLDLLSEIFKSLFSKSIHNLLFTDLVNKNKIPKHSTLLKDALKKQKNFNLDKHWSVLSQFSLLWIIEHEIPFDYLQIIIQVINYCDQNITNLERMNLVDSILQKLFCRNDSLLSRAN